MQGEPRAEPKLKARAGDLVCFTSGQYSDYGIQGHFVALQDITPEHWTAAKVEAEEKGRAAEEALDTWTPESGQPYPPYVDIRDAFLAELIRAGLLLAVTVTELYIGEYGEVDDAG